MMQGDADVDSDDDGGDAGKGGDAVMRGQGVVKGGSEGRVVRGERAGPAVMTWCQG